MNHLTQWRPIFQVVLVLETIHVFLHVALVKTIVLRRFVQNIQDVLVRIRPEASVVVDGIAPIQ